MAILFPCNDEAGKIFAIGTPHEIQSLFFSALPAPVPLYFDGVTLKR